MTDKYVRTYCASFVHTAMEDYVDFIPFAM